MGSSLAPYANESRGITSLLSSPSSRGDDGGAASAGSQGDSGPLATPPRTLLFTQKGGGSISRAPVMRPPNRGKWARKGREMTPAQSYRAPARRRPTPALIPSVCAQAGRSRR